MALEILKFLKRRTGNEVINLLSFNIICKFCHVRYNEVFHSRPGGRIHSCWLGNVVGELGAQWISGGSEANPTFTLACMEGLLKEPLCRRKVTKDDIICLISDGRAIDSFSASVGINIFRNVKRQAFTLFSTDTQKSHGSLQKFIETRISEELKLVPEEKRSDVTKVVSGMVNTLRTRWGTDLTNMSSDAYGSFIEIPGKAIRVPLGFVGVLGTLLRAIPKENISYCKEVDFIKWDTGSPRVLVRCCEGEPISADFCIVTCSLGVLKERHCTMFQPPLPEEKVDAIKALGYGHLNKLIMEYSRPFWACGEGALLLSWDSNELAERCCWSRGISVIEEAPGSANMLMATIGGPEACAMEECSDEEVAVLITQTLRTFTGDFSLPFPVNILRSKWCSDRHFRGANSYMGLHAKVSHQCELGRPLPGACNPGAPVLLFAGEATSPGHFSTVQGARLSGVREAERILQLVRKYRGPPKEESSAAVQ